MTSTTDKPLLEACLLLPLTPPEFFGTLVEYRINREIDRRRHAGVGVSPPPMPLDSSIALAVDGPSTVPPAIATPATSTTPRPATSMSSASGSPQGRGRVPQDSDNHLRHSPHISANMGFPRVVDPLRAEAPQRIFPRVSTASLQQAHTARDSLSLMPIFSSYASKLYTITFMLDATQHPHHVGLKYTFGVDTAGITTWGYGLNFQQIPPYQHTDRGGSPESYPDTIPWGSEHYALLKNRTSIMPVNREGQELPWTTSGAPGVSPDEWCVHYGDGASVYVRHVPEGIIKADFPCWSWTDNHDTTCPLFLPCVLAFGANYSVVEYPPIDGMIGLAVPNLTPPHHHVGGKSDRAQFFDALQEPHPQVYEPRRFLMKLNHPNKVDLCQSRKAFDFLYFGEKFPCPLRPRFTLPIMVYPSMVTAGSASHRSWMLGLKSLNLLVPNSDDASALRIDMINPNIDFVSQRPHFQDLIHVIIDSGTSATYLPESVLDVTRDSWLLNSSDILAHEANREIHSYCGPERNMDECEIAFEFVGPDDTTVEFRCPATPFLKSNQPLPSEDGPGQALPTRFRSNVEPYPDHLDAEDNSRFYFILGINFYWSAFVEHCGPIKDKHTGNRDYSRFSRPYVRLAPQRARKPDGTMGYAEDFTFFPDLAPRYYHASPES